MYLGCIHTLISSLLSCMLTPLVKRDRLLCNKTDLHAFRQAKSPFCCAEKSVKKEEKAQEQTWQPQVNKGVTSQQIVFKCLMYPSKEACFFFFFSWLSLIYCFSCTSHWNTNCSFKNKLLHSSWNITIGCIYCTGCVENIQCCMNVPVQGWVPVHRSSWCAR